MSSESKLLTGRLLVARPELMDPNFFQSIVFIARHDDEGALGFVLNRPVGSSLADCLGKSETPLHFFNKIPVLRGGPVGANRLAVVVFEHAMQRKAIRVRLGLPMEQLEAHLGKPNTWIYAFHGYAGWDAGQLEREIREGSWSVRRSDPVVLNLRVAAGLWPFLISGDDRWRSLLEYLPEESERN